MTAPYTGQCACGQVRLRIESEPLALRQCWCRQCQQVAAGSPTNNALFAAEGFHIEGTLHSHAYVAASGNTLTRRFCPDCGTPVLSGSSARPNVRVVRLGMLEPGHGLRPTMAIWTEEAPDWAAIDPAMEQCARQPAPPTPPQD